MQCVFSYHLIWMGATYALHPKLYLVRLFAGFSCPFIFLIFHVRFFAGFSCPIICLFFLCPLICFFCRSETSTLNAYFHWRYNYFHHVFLIFFYEQCTYFLYKHTLLWYNVLLRSLVRTSSALQPASGTSSTYQKKNKDFYQLGAPRKIYSRHVQSAQNLAQHLPIRKFTIC